jgi:dienelactone hydrolase
MKRILFCSVFVLGLMLAACTPPDEGNGKKVTLTVSGWKIFGTLQIPESDKPVPVVLLLHMKPTDRTSFNRLADLLAERGIASLRIDMRGHGESTNLGGPSAKNDEEAWKDAVEAVTYLQGEPGINPGRIGVLGASYGGEHAAHVARVNSGVKAVVVLSSGSFSRESIQFLGESEAKWWFIAAKDDDDPEVVKLMGRAADAGGDEKAERLIYDTGGHGTFLFDTHDDLEGKIADWFAKALKQ